nr:MAG TPA: hypothetical protein [Caudoviricetes sp.]
MVLNKTVNNINVFHCWHLRKIIVLSMFQSTN